MSTLVRDVMRRDVISVRTSAKYKDILQVMRFERFSAFPVLDADDRVVGVASEDDLLVKEGYTEAGHEPGFLARSDRVKAAAMTAGELMTSPAITIGADATVGEAARVMHARHVKRLPVVSSSGRLIGIVSRTDLLGVYDRADDEIRREIEDKVIESAFGLDNLGFTVTVNDGVVTLAGRVEREPVAVSLLQALQQVNGVVTVKDKLSYPRR